MWILKWPRSKLIKLESQVLKLLRKRRDLEFQNSNRYVVIYFYLLVLRCKGLWEKSM